MSATDENRPTNYGYFLMRKISKTRKPIRKHIRNIESSQNLALICSRQQKVAALQRNLFIQLI